VHWYLLGLVLLAMLACLALAGWVHGVGAEGTGPATPTGPAGPHSIVDGGPVVRIGADGQAVTTSMPAGTVALTFDDGPDPQWTPAILEVLRRHHAHATFFVIGSKVDDYPDLAREIVADGNEIGVHTFTHPDLSAVPGWRLRLELTLTQNAIAAATGQSTTLMRPPYSSEPDAVRTNQYDDMRQIAAAGYLLVLADHDTDDWQRPGVAHIIAAATPAPGQGAVVMMHDGGGDRSQTVAALDQLLTRLDAAHYRATTVSAGLGLGPSTAAPTAVRMRGAVVRWAQWAGDGLVRGMTLLLFVALVLSGLRLALQLVAARVHVARTRRFPEGLRYLGPVTVIVPAYNEQANIAATVRSLVGSDYPGVWVIVVDDGSTDDTAAIVASLRLPNVRLIRQDNAGKPAALNTGIAAARTELVVLVDGDTVLERDAIGRLAQAFRDPQVGAVSGNAKVANRRGLLGRWQHLEYVMGFNLDRRMFEVGRCMPTVPGAIGGFRRTALTDVGGVALDTLAEDTDLTMAVVRAGWSVTYRDDAIAWTEAPSTLRQLWRQRYRWCYGTIQAMWKHHRAFVEGGSSGRLGRRGLGYLLLFQLLLPLAAPAVDVYGLYGLLFLPVGQVAAVWFGLVLAQALTAGYALRLDREHLRPLWTIPLQQLVYRQLMYLVVVHSVVTALAGIRLRWHRIARTGEAQLAVRAGGGARL
jgi:cellulose synthase/poly-beta-1,6-N-acetylglucosamine synthase-like glycosyltransferase/peptidoglycan/xylan/chitin deacetylase (PgdA/CDA1 family)